MQRTFQIPAIVALHVIRGPEFNADFLVLRFWPHAFTGFSHFMGPIDRKQKLI